MIEVATKQAAASIVAGNAYTPEFWAALIGVIIIALFNLVGGIVYIVRMEGRTALLEKACIDLCSALDKHSKENEKDIDLIWEAKRNCDAELRQTFEAIKNDLSEIKVTLGKVVTHIEIIDKMKIDGKVF